MQTDILCVPTESDPHGELPTVTDMRDPKTHKKEENGDGLGRPRGCAKPSVGMKIP